MAEQFVADVRGFRWFAEVGKDISITFTLPFVAVATKDEALEHCGHAVWEYVTLEASNDLTRFLSKHHRERYQQWNEVTDRMKNALVSPLTKEVWQPFADQHGLGKAFV